MLPKTIDKIINSPFYIYIFRCITGFLIGYSIIQHFSIHGVFWCLISIILVISPDEKDAKRLTIERSKSNLIGAVSGFTVFFIPLPDVAKAILAIIIAISICKIFNLMNVARSAIVALLIILIEHKNDGYLGAVLRFAFVTAGCLIGLSITLITSALLNFLMTKKNQTKAAD